MEKLLFSLLSLSFTAFWLVAAYAYSFSKEKTDCLVSLCYLTTSLAGGLALSYITATRAEMYIPNIALWISYGLLLLLAIGVHRTYGSHRGSATILVLTCAMACMSGLEINSAFFESALLAENILNMLRSFVFSVALRIITLPDEGSEPPRRRRRKSSGKGRTKSRA